MKETLVRTAPLQPAQPARSAAELTNLSDAVWETLAAVSPQGVELATLEAIAANLGIPVEALLADEPEPIACVTLDGAPPMSAAAAAEDGGAPGADLSQLVLLSTAPHADRRGATSLGETLRSALHNLAANRTRGLLTMLGIIIGVLTVVLLQAIGNGLIGYVNDLTGDFGGNNVTIQPARLIVNGIDTGVLTRTLTLADAEALAQPGAVPDAVAISPTAHERALIHAGSGTSRRR